MLQSLDEKELKEKLLLLAETPVLSRCDGDYLLHLALMSEFVVKEPGEEICRQGADADMFYILESGEALLEVCSTR